MLDADCLSERLLKCIHLRAADETGGLDDVGDRCVDVGLNRIVLPTKISKRHHFCETGLGGHYENPLMVTRESCVRDFPHKHRVV